MKYLKSIAFWRRIGMIILIALIFVRPTISNEKTSRESTNLNIWFVVDATGSMVAKDVDGGSTRRFEKVQSDITSIIKSVPGAKYGLIVQDFSNYNALPLTYNADAMAAAESNVMPKYSYYSQPTNITELLRYTADRIRKYNEANPGRSNAIIVMSDGEDVSGKSITVPDMKDAVDTAIVFGYGSTAGSVIEEINAPYRVDEEGLFSKDYIKYYGDDERITVDDKYRVISKINEKNLTKISNSLDGSYYHRESGDAPSEVSEKLKQTASVIKEKKESDVNTRSELYYIFALMLLGLIIWEGEELLLKVLLEKENKNA